MEVRGQLDPLQNDGWVRSSFPPFTAAFIAPSHLSVLQFLCQNSPLPILRSKVSQCCGRVFWVQLEMDCPSERCQNYCSTINPCCFQWQDKSKQPQVKSLCSINPSYAHICCYQYVQPDRCIFLSLCAISICMVMRLSKGIQQVRERWTPSTSTRVSFHQLWFSGTGKAPSELSPHQLLVFRNRKTPREQCLSLKLKFATTSDGTSCFHACDITSHILR